MKIKLELTITVIVIATIIVGITGVTAFEMTQCEEHGGQWTRLIDGGCRMESQECRETGGIPIDCLENRAMFHGTLQCTPGCQFR